jgi:hypothetical protein
MLCCAYLKHLYWYILLVHFDRFLSIYKLGFILEVWIPHISVGAEICTLGLAIESWCSFKLALIKPEIVVSCNI